jgi:hypothetical protein
MALGPALCLSLARRLPFCEEQSGCGHPGTGAVRLPPSFGPHMHLIGAPMPGISRAEGVCGARSRTREGDQHEERIL